MFTKRIIALLAAACILLSCGFSALALSGVSEWAKPEVSAAQQIGLLPDTMNNKAATGLITREEFCAVALLLFENLTGASVSPVSDRPFTDTASAAVSTAHSLGLVSGRGNGIFDPSGQITRQELCKMLDNVLTAAQVDTSKLGMDVGYYPDADQVADWAKQPVYRMASAEIMRGISRTLADDSSGEAVIITELCPTGNTTREQAMLLGLRFHESFEGASGYDPEVKGENSSGGGTGTGTSIPDPDGDAGAASGSGSSSGTGSSSGSGGSSEMPSTMPVTEEEKMAFVFGSGGSYFETEEIALAAMSQITVPTWTLNEDGSKTGSTKTLTVNRNLAAVFTAIFIEIYGGAEKFPIKNVGGYAWRSSPTSEHRWGTAVDINWEENFEARINEDGTLTALTGTHWLPGEDPYSIPENGDVYNAFIKYGFAWGGNAWSGKRDYMHFSYFGR